MLLFAFRFLPSVLCFMTSRGFWLSLPVFVGRMNWQVFLADLSICIGEE
jgi:hypothetical protein